MEITKEYGERCEKWVKCIYTDNIVEKEETWACDRLLSWGLNAFPSSCGSFWRKSQ